MEQWMDLPWWMRMIASLIVMAIGGGLLWMVMSGEVEVTGRRGPLVLPGLVILAGLIMFATSFPYDRNKYNF